MADLFIGERFLSRRAHYRWNSYVVMLNQITFHYTTISLDGAYYLYVTYFFILNFSSWSSKVQI